MHLFTLHTFLKNLLTTSDFLGILKVDCLSLGMLTAIHKSLDFISARKGFVFGFQDIPAECPSTYDMICEADTVGVFQIESRAQMSMLPRLQPRNFFDLVIQVAIVRPGPIQGGFIHPYLKRRQGLEPVTYPNKELESVLSSTLGIVLFQEDAMRVAMISAGYSAGEADQLRRDLGGWDRNGERLKKHFDRVVTGMVARGYAQEFAEAIFESLKSLGGYSFPRAHAASFALIAYASCWIKLHYPAEFLAAMLNSQPLGFYTPSQLVQDALRHGVQVRPPDVMHSDIDCTLEGLPHPPAVRLGLRIIDKLKSSSAERILLARSEAPFTSSEDLARRASLEQHEMKLLAAADALMSLAGHRRQQVWEASALRSVPLLLRDAPVAEELLELPAAQEGEEVIWDYASTGLSLRSHPLALLRPQLDKHRLFKAEELRHVRDGLMVRHCGLVTLRQQPPTANGTTFITLEDETGVVQVIVWETVRDAHRQVLSGARLLAVYGKWQREGEVMNLIARKLVDMTSLLGGLSTTSRDYK